MSVTAIHHSYDGQPVPVLRSSLGVDALLAVTIVSLFMGIQSLATSVKLEPFAFLSLVSIVVVFAARARTPRASLPLTLILLSNFLVYCVSAMTVGLFDGIKEAIQVAIVLGFVFSVFAYYTDRSADRFLVIFSMLSFGVLLYNIIWHLMHGFPVGWKRLNEPKTVFILIPMLLILVFERFPQLRRHSIPLISFAIAGAIVLLSGERKAYIFSIVAVVVWLGVLNWRVLLAAAATVPVLAYAVSLGPTSYVSRQVSSLLSSGPEHFDQGAVLSGAMLDTLSDTQRAFAGHLAMSLWQQHPIFGVGTGGFLKTLHDNYQYLPETLSSGIHGEFMRALVENGVVGLTFYAGLWIAAFLRIFIGWRSTAASGNPNLNKLKLLTAIMALIYCAFEANKTMTVIAICILPYVASISAPAAPILPRRPPVRLRPDAKQLERAPR